MEDFANVLKFTGPCPACGRQIEVWETADGDYTVVTDAGIEREHEDEEA